MLQGKLRIRRSTRGSEFGPDKYPRFAVAVAVLDWRRRLLHHYALQRPLADTKQHSRRFASNASGISIVLCPHFAPIRYLCSSSIPSQQNNLPPITQTIAKYMPDSAEVNYNGQTYMFLGRGARRRLSDAIRFVVMTCLPCSTSTLCFSELYLSCPSDSIVGAQLARNDS